MNNYTMHHCDEYWYADFAELLAIESGRIPTNRPRLYESATHKPSATDRPPLKPTKRRVTGRNAPVMRLWQIHHNGHKPAGEEEIPRFFYA